jgi:hypothetical protein
MSYTLCKESCRTSCHALKVQFSVLYIHRALIMPLHQSHWMGIFSVMIPPKAGWVVPSDLCKGKSRMNPAAYKACRYRIWPQCITSTAVNDTVLST